MAVRFIGRNPAKFEFDDGIQKTEVVIQPDDKPDVVRAKLQRVLALEGVPLPMAPQAPVTQPAAPAEPTFTPADRAATEERLRGAQGVPWGEGGDLEQLPEM